MAAPESASAREPESGSAGNPAPEPKSELAASAVPDVVPHAFARLAPLPPLKAVPSIVSSEIVLPKPAEPEQDPLIDLHDEVDDAVIAIFLEEAGELFPQAGEQVRGWRRNPAESSIAQQLRRTLHTFKGSARMAGAMRLGELTHRMESRLMDGDTLCAATPELFEALDTDLDHVAFVLDALREGRTNVPLPWLTPVDRHSGRGRCPGARTRGCESWRRAASA